MRHLNIQVIGQVQGVAFRYSALEKATQLGIKGFARNLPDRSVFIEAEGEDYDLKKFISWCQGGPAFAKVEKVEVKEGSFKNYSDFSIV